MLLWLFVKAAAKWTRLWGNTQFDTMAKANKSKISQGYVFGGVNAVGKATFDGLEAATR